ncbi:hypothetical protein EZH22_24690 [Xanthobacter dioxanivorans]|uniref:Uncharacterized protein n=1 Tax=Xanthobacter dioxanivorans TaxID=2528964 RepID=A0A974PM73_9HYPH|nr:hypothetical protein [Xanthobacter dioxanivorans]QRG06147.1 hypothetical protein EZH22_24690 [Xanthobacter dioxanivorans]
MKQTASSAPAPQTGSGISAVSPPAESGEVEPHPDDLAVDRFAAEMKAKLAQKRAEGRGGWEDKEDCPAHHLSNLLRDHVEKGDPLDVANFAMMLHQRGERITSIHLGILRESGERVGAPGSEAPFAAVAEAREDAKGRLGTLREAMRLRREREQEGGG